jgi:hypothetical protein
MTARAMATRTVMKESVKCRSGRRCERSSRRAPRAVRGKKAKLLGDDEGVATEREGDVMIPSTPASTFEVVEPELPLQFLVDTLGAPHFGWALDAIEPLGREESGLSNQNRNVGSATK